MVDNSRYLVIILAAGKGTRLSADIPKPLYEVNGTPIIDHLFNSFSRIPNLDLLTVVGHQKNKVINHIKDRSSYVVQHKQNGTGSAVLECIDYIKKYKNFFVFVGDTPFINSNNISTMMSSHINSKSDCTFLYSVFPFDLPYARLIFNDNELIELVESVHLLDKQKHLNNLFTSQYLFNSQLFLRHITHLRKDPKTNEYNLTDIINIYISNRYKINPILIEEFWTLMGVNTIDDIAMLNSYK